MKTSSKSKAKPRIIVRRQRVSRHDRDPGAWKVAFADFTTAMMAFFLLLWLIEHASDDEKRAISGYFIQPAGAVTSAGVNTALQPPPIAATQQRTAAWTEEEVRREFQQRELAALEALRASLQMEVERGGSVFAQIKDQILIDISALGLRIQIIDQAQRPMFDLGSANLQPYPRQVLHALAPLLDKVPNRIAISGHTDAVSYGIDAGYSNWELSVDRANAARRALVEGGYPELKVAAAQGMSDIALFKPEAPLDPSNRRIAIIVLKRFAEKTLPTNTPAPTSSAR